MIADEQDREDDNDDDDAQEDLLASGSHVSTSEGTCGKTGCVPSALRQEQFVVNERIALIHYTPAVAEATFRVERSGARIGIESVEANRIRGPFARGRNSVFERELAEATSLVGRRDGDDLFSTLPDADPGMSLRQLGTALSDES